MQGFEIRNGNEIWYDDHHIGRIEYNGRRGSSEASFTVHGRWVEDAEGAVKYFFSIAAGGADNEVTRFVHLMSATDPGLAAEIITGTPFSKEDV